MTAADDRMTVAHHEAGHLVAALLAGLEGVSGELDPPDLPQLSGVVRFKLGADADHFTKAFVAYAGPWSESRFTGTPLRAVIASDRCAADRPVFELVTLFNPRTVEHWSSLLAPHWSVIELAAVAMASKEGPLLPTDPLAVVR